jgi:hypothetical protein
MKRGMWFGGVLIAALVCAAPARADNRVIVRTTNLPGLQTLCALPATCTIVGALDGTLNQVFLVTTPLPLQSLLGLLNGVTGFVSAEADQLLNLVGGLNAAPSPLPSGLIADRTMVAYPANSSTMVWNSYASQPAADVVNVHTAQNTFSILGTAIIADIDTGVDPNHPALQAVLLLGYDFTRNQLGGSEMNDLGSSFTPPTCTSTCPAPAKVNQSTAAVLDQSTAAVLDGDPNMAAFGHGTMVMGVIHLVAPAAQLLPLKAFHSDGTANLSDVLRAIYYGVQNSANVINMSFDTQTASEELQKALDYANQLGVISAASAGNEGQGPPFLVYPAALQNDVMGVASVGSDSTTDNTRSSFSNFGNSIVWVAAPGEQIISTYPFSTYAAGWGTSFSAPFVSGGAGLLRSLSSNMNQTQAAAAVAHAVMLPQSGMGNGRLDLSQALASVQPPGGGSPDYAVSAAPSEQTITAGQTASFTVSAAPQNGSTQTVTWTCTGAPQASTCSVSPQSVTLDGSNVKTATVTLTTTARTTGMVVSWRRFAPPSLRLWEVGLAGMLFAMILVLFNKANESRGRMCLTAMALIVIAGCASCGGGTSSTPPPPPGTQGTPAGSYTITVTGTSGNAVHSKTVKVTVN